jgi:hypothetical protein
LIREGRELYKQSSCYKGCVILDFYCAKCRLGIELDGSAHFTENGIGHDKARTDLLRAYGVTIIRFANDQIRNDFGNVCHQIDTKVKELLNSPQLDKQLPTRPYQGGMLPTGSRGDVDMSPKVTEGVPPEEI